MTVFSFQGARFRSLRLSRGLSQEAFAELVDLSLAAVSKLERGKNAPSFKTLGKMADRLGLKLHELLEQLDDPDDTPKGRLTREIKALCSQLDAPELELLKSQAQGLVAWRQRR